MMPLSIEFSLYGTAAIFFATLLSLFVRIAPVWTRGVQHFAAGVITYAVATQLLPHIVRASVDKGQVVIGFAIGVGLMLFLRFVGEYGFSRASMGEILVSVFDLVIDGFLISLAFLVGERSGILLAFALSIEAFFLALAINAGRQKASWKQKGGILFALGAALPIGAFIGERVLRHVGPIFLTLFFSFGTVVLLFLVVEELLVEAHAEPDVWWVTSLFFIGFLTPLLLS